MRMLSNGYLIAPRRGKPPPAPEGYEAMKGDPYVFVPTLPPCQYREVRPPTSKCCGRADKLICGVVNKQIIRLTCVKCQGDPEWIKSR